MGIAVSTVVSTLLAFGLLTQGPTYWKWVMPICGGGAFLAFLGWLDDCYSLRSSVRFAAHFLAAGWAVYWLMPPDSPLYLKTVATIGIVWAVNFFNFMDGIDGLAGLEAVSVATAGWYICTSHRLFEPQLVSLIIASSALGFLFWNWPPAKIFMGDSGSGFLGYGFGCLSIGSGWGWKGGFGTWAILLFLFWFDASFTLFRRILNRERFWEAHRSHLFQKYVQSGYSHLTVDLIFLDGNTLLALVAIFQGHPPFPKFAR